MALGADQNRVGVLEDIVPGTSRGTSIGTVTIVNHFEKVPERLRKETTTRKNKKYSYNRVLK